MDPKLVVVIDTEEDWVTNRSAPPTVTNIAEIPKLQKKYFDPLSIKPVYLITYPVATEPNCIAIFRELLQADACEVGTHVHNWTSPPFSEEDIRLRTFHTSNSYDLEMHKIAELTHIVEDQLYVKPVSFKGGRWGVNGRTIRILQKLEYKIDTSVCPVTDYSSEPGGPNFFNAPFQPYFPAHDDVLVPEWNLDENHAVLELPVTIGFANPNFEQQRRLLAFIQRNSQFKKMRLIGLLYRLNLVRRIKLSQETATSQEMKQLIDASLARGHELLYLTFHSNILRIGTSPYSKTVKERDERLAHMAAALEYMVNERGVVPETAESFRKSLVRARQLEASFGTKIGK